MHKLTLRTAKECIKSLQNKLEKMICERDKYKTLYQNALICPVTKLPRRTRVEEQHSILLAINNRRASQTPPLQAKPITLVVFDIDNFKDVNDTFGHQEGDRILAHVADVLNSSKRPDDTLVRFGGEEFVALLSDINNECSAHNFVDRVRASVRSICKLPNHSCVSISAGVVVDIEGVLSFSEIFELADKNLYTAKNSGRNRVVSSVA